MLAKSLIQQLLIQQYKHFVKTGLNMNYVLIDETSLILFQAKSQCSLLIYFTKNISEPKSVLKQFPFLLTGYAILNF